MNISTSMAIGRLKEIGIKKVVGALGIQLRMQFLFEAFIQTIFAMIIALMFVELSRPYYSQLTDIEIVIRYTDPKFIAEIITILFATTIISGSYPAFLLSSFKPINAIKGKMTSGKGQFQFRRILVIFQFAASIFLIISTLFIFLQIKFINNKDLGFNKENIVWTYLEGDLNDHFDSFRTEVLKNPSVISLGRTSQLPNNISYGMRGIEWEEKEGDDLASFNFAAVDYDFFETSGIGFIEGRAFSRDFSLDSLCYILNEAAVELTGFKNPIGRKFNVDNDNGRIIGVVKNFHSKPLTRSFEPTFFIMNPEYYTYIMFHIRPENAMATIDFIEEIWKTYVPEYEFVPTYFENRIENYYRSEYRMGKLASSFTIIVIIITCIGLLGMASHTAQRKTKEIGIRKVYGASISNMVYMLVRIFALWIILANIIAWPMAYYFVSGWLQNFAYHIDIYWWVFILSGVLALFIATITVVFQVAKAGRKNPIESLRYE